MLHPSYKEMIRKINDTADEEDMQISSRYSLVIAAAKRARQINSGSEPLVEAGAKEKNLSVAVREFYSGKVHILEDDAEDAKFEETDVYYEPEASDEFEEASDTADEETETPEEDDPSSEE